MWTGRHDEANGPMLQLFIANAPVRKKNTYVHKLASRKEIFKM
jgi:hypothetical protein